MPFLPLFVSSLRRLVEVEEIWKPLSNASKILFHDRVRYSDHQKKHTVATSEVYTWAHSVGAIAECGPAYYDIDRADKLEAKVEKLITKSKAEGNRNTNSFVWGQNSGKWWIGTGQNLGLMIGFVALLFLTIVYLPAVAKYFPELVRVQVPPTINSLPEVSLFFLGVGVVGAILYKYLIERGRRKLEAMARSAEILVVYFGLVWSFCVIMGLW